MNSLCPRCEEVAVSETEFSYVGEDYICEACIEDMDLEEYVSRILPEYRGSTDREIAEDVAADRGCDCAKALSVIRYVKAQDKEW